MYLQGKSIFFCHDFRELINSCFLAIKRGDSCLTLRLFKSIQRMVQKHSVECCRNMWRGYSPKTELDDRHQFHVLTSDFSNLVESYSNVQIIKIYYLFFEQELQSSKTTEFSLLELIADDSFDALLKKLFRHYDSRDFEVRQSISKLLEYISITLKRKDSEKNIEFLKRIQIYLSKFKFDQLLLFFEVK
jgi:hypothetical protein